VSLPDNALSSMPSKRALTKKPTVIKKPPFRIDEKGWGEFDMTIVLSAVGKGGDHTLAHDLNFQAERYEAKHQVVSTTYMYYHLAQHC
jgi:transcription initiation factor IIF auxiliary subunit